MAVKKKAKDECSDLIQQIKEYDDKVIQTEQNQADVRVVIDKMISTIGNIVADDVPVGNDEDTGNRVERKWGTPRDPAGLLNHHDLLWRIGGYEPERGSNVAGHRGYFLKDAGVLLNQAFINYGIAFLRAREYSILQPPYMMKKDIMAGVAQLEQFDEELYKVGGDGDDKYLIATSEQPICAYHQNEWMEEKNLPLRYSGISTCFRKEAGSHGKDTWGIFRVHQFEKVEQFVICDGDIEKSKLLQDEMIKTAEEFYQSLGFPYHVINIVSGALNNAAIKKLDLECWFPGYNAYRELVSCSNCTDYQSRAMEIRCGLKKQGDREKKYVHMLNATLCATGRAICCLLETYQEKDGVRIPEVLVPYMAGITFLPFVRGPRDGDKKTAVPATAAATSTASTATVPAVAVAAAPTDPLVTEIISKGMEIRSMKEKKGDKDSIKKLVDELNVLKIAYKEKTGKDYGDAPPKVDGEKKDKKVAAPAVVKAAVVHASAPAIPAPFPNYTSPAPKQVATSSKINTAIPADEFINSTGKVDVSKLENHLKSFSYVGGYIANKGDAVVLKALGTDDYNKNVNVNITRWLKNIKSFSDDEVAQWL